MSQPPGFVDSDKPHHVCKLHKAIYGLKQAPRAWYNALREFLLSSGFVNSIADTSLFSLHHHSTVIHLLVYVDDMIVTGNCPNSVQRFITLLAARFSIKDLGDLSYFLGVEVTRNQSGILLTQSKYILDLLHRTNMTTAKPIQTPMCSTQSLSITDGVALTDPTEYRMIIGSLQYLLLTRPDLAFAVNRLSQFMHKPTSAHILAARRVLRYLCGTPTVGLHLSSVPSTNSICAYSDSDWAGNKDDYTSTGAHLIYIGTHLVSWSSKKQKSVARSSTEAEYRSVADTASEVKWIQSLLAELGVKQSTVPTIFCDNVGATYLCANPVFHSRIKHVAINFHFIRDLVQSKQLQVSHVASKDQLADALTKPLSRASFLPLCIKIGLSRLQCQS